MRVSEVNAELLTWLEQVADARTHGSTGRVPAEHFAEDLAAMLPLPQARFEPVVWRKAKVHRDGHVCFDRQLYSVPWTLLGEEVWVRATPSTVVIQHDDVRVATHPRSERRRTTDPLHLPEGRAELRRRDPEYWLGLAEAIGPETAGYCRAVLASDQALSKLPTVQKIVLHLQDFERQRAEGASRRALHYGSYGYGSLKRILEQGLDLLPLDEVTRIPEQFGRPESGTVWVPLDIGRTELGGSVRSGGIAASIRRPMWDTSWGLGRPVAIWRNKWGDAQFFVPHSGSLWGSEPYLWHTAKWTGLCQSTWLETTWDRPSRWRIRGSATPTGRWQKMRRLRAP